MPICSLSFDNNNDTIDYICDNKHDKTNVNNTNDKCNFQLHNTNHTYYYDNRLQQNDNQINNNNGN